MSEPGQTIARAETALRKGDAQTNSRARLWLRHWKTDGELASVRTRDSIARLPADERKQWATLWSDVDALLRRLSRRE